MRIDHYEVKGEIARGGMGIVYRARDTQHGSDVVLKLLQVDSEKSRRRLKREAAAMARLRHPSVLSLLGVGEHQGFPYLVLPYVEGDSLDGVLERDGPLPVERVIEIGDLLADGLQAAHELGLVHRDVKPANVLVHATWQGKVKLTDFGLVKDVGVGGAQTVSLSANTAEGETPRVFERDGVWRHKVWFLEAVKSS